MIWFFCCQIVSATMEELMSEAADLILSPNQNEATGPNEELKSDFENGSKPAQDSMDINSITLLRASITHSLRHRHIETEDMIDKPPKIRRNKRRKEYLSESSRVSVQQLNSDVVTVYTGRKAVEDNGHCSDGLHEQISSNITTKIFTNLLKRDAEVGQNVSNVTEFSTISDHEAGKDDNKLNIIPLASEEQSNRKKQANNGIKLASRKFSDNIFENCSTYGLACPQELSVIAKQVLISNSQSSSGNGMLDVKDIRQQQGLRNTASENNIHEVSLSDSFFVNITNDETVSKNGFFYKDKDNSCESKRSVKDSSSKENGVLSPEASTNDVGEMSQKKSERRLSKKLRKRNKKSKSKDVPTYECLKCGVSYILTNKVSERTACCLHCDFWTSVEPEFVKREKQPWNTCRIC